MLINAFLFNFNALLCPVVFYMDGSILPCFVLFCSPRVNRYSPKTPPTYNTFPVRGITISSGSYFCNQFMCNAEIDGLSQLSSGTYKCEVSEDAPEFKLIDQTANMTVGGMYYTLDFTLLYFP